MTADEVVARRFLRRYTTRSPAVLKRGGVESVVMLIIGGTVVAFILESKPVATTLGIAHSVPEPESQSQRSRAG